MTAMPENFPAQSPIGPENACWRSSQRLVMTWLITVPMANMTARRDQGQQREFDVHAPHFDQRQNAQHRRIKKGT